MLRTTKEALASEAFVVLDDSSRRYAETLTGQRAIHSTTTQQRLGNRKVVVTDAQLGSCHKQLMQIWY